MIDVSIVVRTKNQREYLEHSLPMIWTQKTAFSFEVVIVDSGSPAEVIDWIRKECESRPATLVRIKPENFGFSYSLNLGVRHSNGQYIICLSGDAIPADPSWLDNLVQPLQKPNVAGVYGRQQARDKARFIERIKYAIRYHQHSKTQSKSHIFSNVNSAFKKSLAKKYLFDESIPVCEDYAWAREVQRAGYVIVYQPNAVVYHSHKTGTLEQIRRVIDFRIWRFRIDHLHG